MNEISVNYRHLSPKAIHLLGSRIHTALTTEPCLSYFPIIDPPPAQLLEQNEFLGHALSQETCTSITALRKSWAKEVADTLTEIAASLEKTARGDLMKL